MTAAIRKQIAEKAEKNLTEKGIFVGTTKEKLNQFVYAVSTIKNEIGEIAFFEYGDHEYTTDDETVIYDMIMA